MSDCSIRVTVGLPAVTAIVSTPQVVNITNPGSQGPAGPPGPVGPPGPPGPNGDLHFLYTQGVASAFWDIIHNLGKFPSVSIVDSTGRNVEGDITYIDVNQLTLSFSNAFAGVAYLN